MENKDEDVELYLYNQIGDIKDSRINKIEQVLNISPNIPDDLKEAFELYLNLMNEDLLWKQAFYYTLLLYQYYLSLLLHFLVEELHIVPFIDLKEMRK